MRGRHCHIYVHYTKAEAQYLANQQYFTDMKIFIIYAAYDTVLKDHFDFVKIKKVSC